MSQEFDSGINKIKLSCLTTDKKHGTWWALGTEKEWIEIRTTKAGKIKPFIVHKGKHPYFTVAHIPQKANRER